MSEPLPPGSEEAHELVGLLKRKVVEQGFRLHALAKKLGWSAPYTLKVLREAPDLKLRRLFAILAAIEVSPAQFFAALYPQPAAQPCSTSAAAPAELPAAEAESAAPAPPSEAGKSRVSKRPRKRRKGGKPKT